MTREDGLYNNVSELKQIEKNICKPCKERKDDYNGVRCRTCQYGDEIDDIEDAPTAGEWIPCSKRLPERGCSCLVTDEERKNSYEFVLCDLTIDRKLGWSYEGRRIIAWMPLPEPYKE